MKTTSFNRRAGSKASSTTNGRTYRVRTLSGQMGWRSRLHVNYETFASWESYAWAYGLHTRLGYNTPEAAWGANPVIEGGTNPDDYRKVRD